MVTGDYYHTAIAVAKNVGMVPSTSRLIIIQTQDKCRGTSARKPQPTAKAPTKTTTGNLAALTWHHDSAWKAEAIIACT